MSFSLLDGLRRGLGGRRSRDASMARPCTSTPTHVKRLEIPGDRLSAELTLTTRLRRGDLVLCVPGDVVPSDSELVEGLATVDLSALGVAAVALMCRTDESASIVAAGAVVVSGSLVIRIS
jgi:K+-transporting ATPase ATPase B chain